MIFERSGAGNGMATMLIGQKTTSVMMLRTKKVNARISFKLVHRILITASLSKLGDTQRAINHSALALSQAFHLFPERSVEIKFSRNFRSDQQDQ